MNSQHLTFDPPGVPYLALKGLKGYCTLITLWPLALQEGPNVLQTFFMVDILTVIISAQPGIVSILTTYMFNWVELSAQS